MQIKGKRTPPLFQLKQVTKYCRISLSSTITVLKEVSVHVDKGSLITIIGPSGAGKSTLLSLLNRLEDVDGGEIYFQEKEIKQWDVLELRRQVGLVFQIPVMLPGTVKDNLLYGPGLRGQTPPTSSAEIIKMVGLEEKILERNSSNLSGGQKQRVALARTIANGSRILLLDEVTSSLDHESAMSIENLIINLNKEHGYTCLWVTHDRLQAQRVSPYSWSVHDGKIELIVNDKEE
ncbi:MAG: phosphate ABC transporter ATP-binding protein [Firmicutes bacterium]|nr:phosphate ABC transporter ATP-binding protein [Bacillota bacterium]